MIVRIVLLFSFFFHFNMAKAQDSTFVKSFYGGSTTKVPEDKTWVIKNAFITAGDGYNIKIALTNFEEKYAAGQIVNFPYYIAEMELLSDRSNVSYILTIRELKLLK
jgi:hypothetical protein